MRTIKIVAIAANARSRNTEEEIIWTLRCVEELKVLFLELLDPAEGSNAGQSLKGVKELCEQG
jgi:hypothetical protein